MRLTLPVLLFIALILSAGEGDISISGSSSFFSSYSSEETGWSEMPEQFWRWRFNPVVNVYGIPVVASVFVSSEESLERQNMNRVYVSSSPSASSGESSILSFVTTVGIGAFNPYFSELTLNAANISGANVALDPGVFHFAAAGGRNVRAVNPDGDDPGSYRREIWAVQTGLGSPFGSHLHLCVLHGKDEYGSIEEDSTFRITPQENWVASIDVGAMLGGGKFRIEGELAGSVLTRDQRSPQVDSDEVPQWLIDFAGINVSSGFGWAVDVVSSARFSSNMLSLAFERVEPGFQSMGAPYLRSDRMAVEARADRYFRGRELFAGIYYRWERDNLLSMKTGTTTGNSYGFRVGAAFPGYPRISVSYSPSSLENDDSTSAGVETSTLSISGSYRSTIAGLDVNSSASVSLHDNSMGQGSGDYSMLSGTLRETVSLNYPVVLTGCLSARRTRLSGEEEWSYTGDVRGTWFPSSELSVTLGGYYSTGDDSRRMGLITRGGIPLMQWLTLELSGEYADYTSTVESDRSVLSGGGGLTVVW